MTDPTKELAFQNDVIEQMVGAGWKLGEPMRYDRMIDALLNWRAFYAARAMLGDILERVLN